MTGKRVPPSVRRLTVAKALEADLLTLDGSLGGKETLVALARRLAEEISIADSTRDVTSCAAELRQVVAFLTPAPTQSGDALDDLAAMFGKAAVGDTSNT